MFVFSHKRISLICEDNQSHFHNTHFLILEILTLHEILAEKLHCVHDKVQKVIGGPS